MLFAYPIISADSYALNDYFLGAAHDLDEACRDHITMLYIGDPARCGLNHEVLRNDELRGRDEADAREWVESVYHTGREQHQRLAEMGVLRETLSMSETSLPAIAFLGRTGNKPVGILHIPARWYEPAASRRGFDTALRKWLGCDDVKRVAAEPYDSHLPTELGELLTQLTVDVDIEIAPSDPRSTTRATTQIGRAEEPVLLVDTDTQQVFYKGQEVLVRNTAYRIVEALAQKPGQLVPYAELIDRASRRPGEFEGSSSRWAKDHKLVIMKELRKRVGRDGVTPDEIATLLTVRNGCHALNLHPGQVEIK